MKCEILSVKEFLDRILEFSGDYVMYSEKNKIERDNSLILALNNEYNLPDTILSFKRQLSCGDVEGIMDNLSSQIYSPTLDDYVEAINYYIENDAFIDKENPDNKPQGGYKIWGMAGTSNKLDI